MAVKKKKPPVRPRKTAAPRSVKQPETIIAPVAPAIQQPAQAPIKERRPMNEAIGLVETKGLVTLVEVTDAMAKAANVEIVKRISIGGGLVTAIVRGDVGSVRAAVEAGVQAGQQVGEVAASHVIPRPSEGLVKAYFS
jgi:ethanolamine utilization protein EutM